MNFECPFFPSLNHLPLWVFFWKVSLQKCSNWIKLLCIKFPLYVIRRGGVDSLKILRKGQSVSQYNKTKSKRDQYSCQKKCFLWRVKKNSDLAFSQVCMKTSQKSWTLSVFWGLLQLRYNNTIYNGSPSFQPRLWYINLKMSLLNTKKDFSLCFHFPLVLFLFSLS